MVPASDVMLFCGTQRHQGVCSSISRVLFVCGRGVMKKTRRGKIAHDASSDMALMVHTCGELQARTSEIAGLLCWFIRNLTERCLHSRISWQSDYLNLLDSMRTEGCSRKEREMGQWAYKVVYIDYRGRISCEGVETLLHEGERKSSFARRYLNGLGKDSWELVGIQPLTTNSAYYILKRPAQDGDYAEAAPSTASQQQTPPPPVTPTEGGSPTIESV